MKFLIVLPECGFSSSSSSIFAKNFLTELSKVHHVDVIGFKLPDNYLHGISRADVNISQWIELESNQVIRRAPKSINSVSNTHKAPRKKTVDFLKSFIPDFYTLGLLDIKNLDELAIDTDYDYMISMSDPKSAHFLSIYLKSRVPSLRNVKVIQMWGDPWFFDITKPTNLMTKLVESFLLKRANLIFYRSRATITQQKKFFSFAESRMHMIDRGFIGAELIDVNLSIKKESFNFLYLGDYSPEVRDVEQFCKAASDYGHNVRLIGNAPYELKERLNKITNITQIERLSPCKLQPYIDSSDCLIVVLNKRGTQVPGKIYDLLTVQKPAILLLDGEVKKEDIPTYERFTVIENNHNALNLFFQNLDSLDCVIGKQLNVFHMKNIINIFTNKLGS